MMAEGNWPLTAASKGPGILSWSGYKASSIGPSVLEIEVVNISGDAQRQARKKRGSYIMADDSVKAIIEGVIPDNSLPVFQIDTLSLR